MGKIYIVEDAEYGVIGCFSSLAIAKQKIIQYIKNEISILPTMDDFEININGTKEIVMYYEYDEEYFELTITPCDIDKLIDN